MKDFVSVDPRGNVHKLVGGSIFTVPRDVASIMLVMNSGGDVRPLRHLETCPHCKHSHACTLEIAAKVLTS